MQRRFGNQAQAIRQTLITGWSLRAGLFSFKYSIMLCAPSRPPRTRMFVSNTETTKLASNCGASRGEEIKEPRGEGRPRREARVSRCPASATPTRMQRIGQSAGAASQTVTARDSHSRNSHSRDSHSQGQQRSAGSGMDANNAPQEIRVRMGAHLDVIDN